MVRKLLFSRYRVKYLYNPTSMLRILISLWILLLPNFLFAAVLWDANLRDTSTVTVDNNVNGDLATFAGNGWITDFFVTPTLWSDSVQNSFVNIAWAIKNFFILIAVIFLIIGIVKLLFRSGEEEDLKKWRHNIIYVSVGIFIMQIGFSVWKTLYLDTTYTGLFIDGRVGWLFWANILEPIVNIMFVLASFGFLGMAVYAFYTLVTANGSDERAKKWKNIAVYAVIWYILIRVPKVLIPAIYGEPAAPCKNKSWLGIGTCTLENKNLANGINIFGKILTYVSGFLALIAVVLVIYAGWLIFTSAGEEEKLKKAKNILIYVAIGFVALVASHVIFRFFFLGTAGA